MTGAVCIGYIGISASVHFSIWRGVICIMGVFVSQRAWSLAFGVATLELKWKSMGSFYFHSAFCFPLFFLIHSSLQKLSADLVQKFKICRLIRRFHGMIWYLPRESRILLAFLSSIPKSRKRTSALRFCRNECSFISFPLPPFSEPELRT